MPSRERPPACPGHQRRAVIKLRVIFALTTVVVGCGGSSASLDALRPPPECLKPDPPGLHGGDAIRIKVGRVYEAGIVMTLAGQSSPGVMAAERQSDRMRFTAVRPGLSKVYLVQDGFRPGEGCIHFKFRAEP